MCWRLPCRIRSIVSPSLTPPCLGIVPNSVSPNAVVGAVRATTRRLRIARRCMSVQRRTCDSGRCCVLPIRMSMPRKCLIVLLATLAAPTAARAELSVTTPPTDLAPTLALATVSGLPSAPSLPALPQLIRKLRYGTPGTNVMRARSDRGVELHGLEGHDRLYGAAGPDLLYGETGPDLILGGRGADLLDGSSGGDRLRGGGGPDREFGGFGMDDLDGG